MANTPDVGYRMTQVLDEGVPREEDFDEEDEFGSEEISNRSYNDSPASPDAKTVARVQTAVNEDGSLRKLIRARRSDFVHNLIYLDGGKFSFAGRDYLRPLYDRDDRQILLKTARQVEKCQSLHDVVTLSDGRRITSANLKIGDSVVSFYGFQPTKGRISAIESNGTRRVVKITTKKKRSVTVTLNHPFRTLLGWTPAEQLSVGDFVALPHRAGEFGDINAPNEASILGHLLAEGHFGNDYVQFTQNPGSNLKDFLSNCSKYGCDASAKVFPSRPNIARVSIYKREDLYKLAESAMKGKKSATLSIPEWIYASDEVTTREFLKSLWAGDGSCKDYSGERNALDLCYSSTSKDLAEGVQDLLLKFGIFSVIRENFPTLYKGTDKKAYILRVADERSFKRFHTVLGSIIGKEFSLGNHGGKDQSDIIPKKGLKELIRQITRGEGKARDYGVNTLHSHGLRASPYYNLQRNKFLKYCEVLQDVRLWEIYDGEVYWDSVDLIEDAGEEETIAVEVEGNHNFITGGIITHNTTFLANNLAVTSVVQPYNKALYVSPSHTQTRQFSNEKLRPVIEKSPLIKRYFQDSSVSYQVFEKGFTNGSYIFLRSAFRSADRTRGISACNLCINPDTFIYVEGLGQVKIKNIYLNLAGKKILSFNEKTGKSEYALVHKTHKTKVGNRRLLKLTTKTGREVIATDDHPVLTWEGWKELKNVCIDDHVLELPVPFTEESKFTEDETFFLGAMLGDGVHDEGDTASFGTTNEEALKCFLDVVERLKFNYFVTNASRISKLSGKLLTERRVCFYLPGEGASCKTLLERAGILGQAIDIKAIPFLNVINEAAAIRLFEGLTFTDGCIHSSFKPENKKSPLTASISLSSTSKQLAQDFATLLRMLGASSIKVCPKKNNNGISKKDQFLASCRTFNSIEKIMVKLKSLPGKEKALRQLIRNLSKHNIGKNKDDLTPIWGEDIVGELKASLTTKGSSLRKWCLGNNFYFVLTSRLSRHMAQLVAQELNDDDLKVKVGDGMYWTPVVKVEEINSSQDGSVYDISMESNFNFLANNVVFHNCLDEIQDFVTSEIPVIMECTSHFPEARILMAGTPKSHDNPIEIYWGSTSQNEWMVKCRHCGKWNFLDEQNIAATELYISGALPPGPVCKGCQKSIYPHQDGKWVSFKSGQSIVGYRIPQLMVPWICGLYDQWLKLLWKRDNYPFGQFNNEVLGLSHDSASKPITREELIECCADYSLWAPTDLNSILQQARRYQLTAGVDWGEGNDGSEKSPTGKIRVASYTVLTIGAYIDQRIWRTLLIKKYQGKEIEPDYIVKDIVRIVNALDIKLVGVDWGHGWGVNNQLIRYLGPKRVVQYQHLPKLKQKMKWDALGFRYHLSRNFMMSELFFDIRNKLVQFPKWREFEIYAKDILGIYAEYVEYRREIKFDHRPSDPDDFFHSLLYAKLTSDVYLGKSRRYTFDIPDGIGSSGLSRG